MAFGAIVLLLGILGWIIIGIKKLNEMGNKKDPADYEQYLEKKYVKTNTSNNNSESVDKSSKAVRELEETITMLEKQQEQWAAEDRAAGRSPRSNVSTSDIQRNRLISPKHVFHENYVSYSRLKTFDNCPRLFELVYLCGNEDVSGYAAERGNLVHKILELYLKDKVGTSIGEVLEKENDFIHVMRSCYTNAIEELNLDNHFTFDEILSYLTVFKHLNSDRENILSNTELTINHTYDGYNVKCIIDRIEENEGLHLIDYKTGRSDYVQNRQLELYALAMNNDVDIHLEYQFLGENTAKKWKFTKSKENAIKTWLGSKIEQIESTRDFPRKRSGLCKYCTFNNKC